MGRFDKLREEKGGLAQRFNFSISCNKKEKVAPCKKGTLKVANLARSTFSILLNDQKLHSPLKNWTWHFHRPGPGSLRRWIGLWRDGGWGWCYVWVGCRWCLGWWWCWLASSLLPRSAKRLQPAHGLRSVAPPPGLRVSGREWCEWVSEGQLADIPRLPLFSTVTETGPAPRQGDIWAKQPARLADAEGTLRSRTMPKLYQKISNRVKVESWRTIWNPQVHHMSSAVLLFHGEYCKSFLKIHLVTQCNVSFCILWLASKPLKWFLPSIWVSHQKSCHIFLVRLKSSEGVRLWSRSWKLLFFQTARGKAPILYLGPFSPRTGLMNTT